MWDTDKRLCWLKNGEFWEIEVLFHPYLTKRLQESPRPSYPKLELIMAVVNGNQALAIHL